jgi:hypothetical protein
MGFEYRRNGRKMSSKAFFDGIKKDMIDKGMTIFEDRVHAAASSIVDPETGMHPEVILRRTGENSAHILTAGSKSFARELERRLGIEEGQIKYMTKGTPRIYLAHATEDKTALAIPLAEKLMANGIDVWLDKWEIGYGDSLVQRMEEGLDDCTHFVVLLTPTSITKKWVRAEIDSGFTNDIDGKAKFIGLRNGLEIDDLTPFLRTRFCPHFDLNDDNQFQELLEDIFGLSRKPELGDAPSFVQNAKDGLSKWSKEALGVAEYLITESKYATKFDPQTNFEQCAKATGFSEEDVRLGVLDLEGAGLVETISTFSSSEFHPLIGLFVEFDPHFAELDNRRDAYLVAKTAYEENPNSADTSELHKKFEDWPLRRFNSALNVLEETRVITADRYIGGGNLTFQAMFMDDKTLRYLRRHPMSIK